MNVPLGKPFLGIKEQEAISKVIDSKYIASGNVTISFEDALALKFKRKYCVAVNSGSSALCLSLKVLGLRNIILPSITCPDVLHAILNAGSKPIFSDIESETHNIDLSTLPENQLKNADGLIVTHTYGHSADMDMVNYYTNKYNLTLVEDFAQAMGGNYKEIVLGSLGKISTTSFNIAKNITTGYGGAILTDDPEIYKKCLHARNDTPYNYYRGIVPLNYKMTSIQAAIGLIQLKKLDDMVYMRRSSAYKLTAKLNELKLRTPSEKPSIKHAYYKYHLVLPEYIPKQEFMAEMDKHGVSTGPLYEPQLHKTLLSKNMFGDDISLPVSEDIAPRTVSLPIFPEMTDSDISQVYHAIKEILGIMKE